ncbi:hypothetical protein [Algicola sagamiensis]|uniref:hypothetical protein n=1 Tax=Algicola sagamiensis TaxID=163869 RepID=UPI000364149A|nr:hypothetical protein [Algicola sagamiensis]
MNTKDSYTTEISIEELGFIIQIFGKGAGVKVQGLHITADDASIFKLSVTSDTPFPNLKEMFQIEEVEQRERYMAEEETLERLTEFTMNTTPQTIN